MVTNALLRSLGPERNWRSSNSSSLCTRRSCSAATSFSACARADSSFSSAARSTSAPKSSISRSSSPNGLMSERKRETSSTSPCAFSRLFQKSGAAMRASSLPNCSCSLGRSKKPPQLAQTRFQVRGVDGGEFGRHVAIITQDRHRARRVCLWGAQAAGLEFAAARREETTPASRRSSQASGLCSPELFARGVFSFWLSRFQTENRFAFFHQVELVARDRFQIRRIGLEQIHFARLLREQHLLFVHLRLQIVDLAAAPIQARVLRHEQTNDHENEGEDEKTFEHAIESRPDGRFAPRAKINVLHVSASYRRKSLCHPVLQF